ncbi:MFS transporter [Alcaligenaceae bacterium 429]|nr:MFS transporter [Alcaligenaceae bacterium 429]
MPSEKYSPLEDEVISPANNSEGPDGLPLRERIPAVITLLLAIAISVLDAAMSNVALPVIAEELHINASRVVWIPIAYSLTIVMTLLPLSAVAERIGLRRLFVAGTVIFLVASCSAAFSQSFAMLLMSRIMQGLGASMLMCLFGSLVRMIYPLEKLAVGISLNVVVVSTAAVLAPSIGAFVLDVASWRWIFFITVPICALTWLGVRYLPESPRVSREFDWLACLLSATVFGLAILGLDLLTSHPIWSLGCLIVAAFSARILLARSLQQEAPVVPVDILRITSVGYAVLASLFAFATQMSAMVSLPFYFVQVIEASYADIGLYMGMWPLGVVVMAPLSAYLSGRFPVAVLCMVGMVVTAIGLSSLLWWGAGAADWQIMTSMMLCGVGFGFFQTPNNKAMLAGVPRRRSGVAGGLQATTRVFGQSFGTALVALVFGASPEQGAVWGIGAAVVCALVALGINIVRQRNPETDPDFL